MEACVTISSPGCRGRGRARRSEPADGVTLFRYDAGRGTWREVAQFSVPVCGKYGVPKSVQSHLPACTPG